MNKQEAIERIKNIDTLNINDINAGQQVDMVIKNQVLDIVSKIDEPQKVVVPKFVADWIKERKRSGWDLQKVLSRLDDDEKVGDWAYDENDDLMPEKADMIARAWLDGYEIGKEKLYTVEIPDQNVSGDSKIYLVKNKDGKVELFIWSGYTSIEFADDWKQEDNLHLTEAEIRKDFEWAWKWAKEVE